MTNTKLELESEALALAIHEFQVATPGLQTCALIYGVAYPQLYRELRQWLGHDTADQRLSLIFDAHSEDRRDQYGPYLVRIAPGASKPASLLTKLARCCVDDFRGVSFLFSQFPLGDLVTGLRERLDVTCADRSEWQMKFFDTRSLAVLDRTLSVEQRCAYLCLVNEWWYIDRYGSLQRIVGDNATADSYRAPLDLDEQQAVAFIDAGLADSVLYSLGMTDDDLLAAFDARTRYRICEESLAGASGDERNSALLLADRVREALLSAQERSETE
ncbi:DUF4123 domain-containing protein [Burkholderia sp. S171]|uniref:DUF4123 domain-containing protein n=1 Tax=Burkholderia sp. S171 TaxID=1641860 RepID=UPI00131A7251|nr:DUF4123 domain-containing protein [Burkholderia sp. S171]